MTGDAIAPGTRDEFAVRYYRWALDDVRRELREEFPLLRQVKNASVSRFLAHLRSLDEAARLTFATGLVKRNHRRALEVLGEPFTAEDERLGAQYRAIVMARAPGEGPSEARLARTRLLAALKAELAPILGPGAPFSTNLEWRFETPLGDWTLVTLVDVGGRSHQLAYEHRLRAGPPRPLKEGISIIGWLGLGGAQTTWNRLVEGDQAAAATSLARLCAHFARAAPGLLAGLSPA